MSDETPNPTGAPRGLFDRLADRLDGWDARREAIFVLLTLAVFTCGAMQLWGWTLDDALISLRYAQHLARYGVLSFNLVHVESPPTEGFSSPLWVASLAGLILTGIKAIPMMKALSLLGGYALFSVTALLFWKRLRISAVIPLAFLALSFPVLYYAATGMELTWTWALLFAWLYFHTAPRPAPLATRIASGVCLALLALIRPEGILFTAVAGLDAALGAWRSKDLKAEIRERGLPLALPILAWGGYEIFRLAHYGMVFPNTYYAKWLQRGAPAAERLQTGFFPSVQYTLTFLGGLWPAALLAEWIARPSPENVGWRALRLPLYLSAAAGWGFLWSIVSDNLPFYRFQMYTALPVLVGGSALLTEAIVRTRMVRVRIGLAALFVGALSGYGVMSHDLAARESAKIERYGATWHQSTQHQELGRRLKTLFRPGDLLLYEEMGAVPYFSGLDFIDFMGLNDRRIAAIIYTHRQSRGGFAFPPEPLSREALSRRPDGVLLRAMRPLSDPSLKRWWKNRGQVHEVWFTMTAMPGFRKCYEFLERFELNRTYYVYIHRLRAGCDPLADGGAEPEEPTRLSEGKSSGMADGGKK